MRYVHVDHCGESSVNILVDVGHVEVLARILIQLTIYSVTQELTCNTTYTLANTVPGEALVVVHSPDGPEHASSKLLEAVRRRATPTFGSKL